MISSNIQVCPSMHLASWRFRCLGMGWGEGWLTLYSFLRERSLLGIYLKSWLPSYFSLTWSHKIEENLIHCPAMKMKCNENELTYECIDNEIKRDILDLFSFANNNGFKAFLLYLHIYWNIFSPPQVVHVKTKITKVPPGIDGEHWHKSKNIAIELNFSKYCSILVCSPTFT